MLSEFCGSSLLLALPYDVFSIVSQSLSPKDICNLSLCCKSMYTLASSDKVWFAQCDMVGIVTPPDLVEWRKGVSCYKALCRFLVSVKPLVGIWVLQNPELGNVVYVMPGFVSVVGCRIIPQELGPLGIEDGPILWAPVFEILGDFNGSTVFFLHGRENGHEYLYPGSVKHVDPSCNVMLLEVEPRKHVNVGKLTHSQSFVDYPQSESFDRYDPMLMRNAWKSGTYLTRSEGMFGQNEPSVVSFSRLAFGDRRKLLDIVTSQVRLKVPDSANGPLFPRLRDDEKSFQFQQDLVLLSERRSMLMQIYKVGGGRINWKADPDFPSDPTELELSEIRKSLDRSSGFRSPLNGDDCRTQSTKRKTLGGYFRESLKQILGKSNAISGSNAILKNSSSSSDNKHAQLHEFLKSGDTIGLTIHASKMKLSSYRAWPNMPDHRFALYKLPMRVPTADQEYAGLWGGTFGWPPGKPTEDKPGKALFFLLLSYEEAQGQRHLIATKILEGTHYVLHPNGSAMFMVNIDDPSTDTFPWETDGESLHVNVKHAYMGEGIANGYGFRYPGSKPGSLFVVQNGLLAFIWKESRAVLTLQRLNLQELLKKGERMFPLSPIANFSYLTKSYSNVFAGFSNMSSPRQTHS